MPIIKINPKEAKYYYGGAAGMGYQALRKTVEFDATATAATIPLFSTDGSVVIRLACVCTETCTTTGAVTGEVGIATDTASMIAQVANMDLILDGEIWHDATPDSDIEAASVMCEQVLGATEAIGLKLTAGTTVDDGTLVFTLFWTPLSTGAVVLVV